MQVAGLNDAAGPDDAAPQVLGTLQYTAPECLLLRRPPSGPTCLDLGVLAYQMLSGPAPWRPRSPARAPCRTCSACATWRGWTKAAPSRRDRRWLERAVHPKPAKRHEALGPNCLRLAPTRRRGPFCRPAHSAQRHPVRFWQAVSLVLH